MRIIVFGASGSIGRHITAQALAMGHSVSAFTRNRVNLQDLKQERLNILEGDVLDIHAVEKAISGQEAVICALGAGRKGLVRAGGTFNIIEAMKRTGVRRLLVLSTLGAGDSWQNLNFFWKYIMFGWFLKEAYRDHLAQEAYVVNSGLDWTIIRPGAFTNGKATGIYKHGFSPDDKAVSLKISKPDIAGFFLLQLNSRVYLRKAVSISY